MKKIVNICFLVIICLLPIVGSAKTSAVYEWKLDDNAIISKKDGDYYFISFENFTMNVYSKEGEKLSSSDFSRLLCGYSFDEIMNDEVLSKIYSYQSSPLLYNSELNEYYDVHYNDKTYRIFDADMKPTGILNEAFASPTEKFLNMEEALKYINSHNAIIISHSEDSSLANGGCINEGKVATRLGLKGIPDITESLAVARELEVVRSIVAIEQAFIRLFIITKVGSNT